MSLNHDMEKTASKIFWQQNLHSCFISLGKLPSLGINWFYDNQETENLAIQRRKGLDCHKVRLCVRYASIYLTLMATERSVEKTALFRRFKILQLFCGKAQDKHLGQPKCHGIRTKGEIFHLQWVLGNGWARDFFFRPFSLKPWKKTESWFQKCFSNHRSGPANSCLQPMWPHPSKKTLW